MKSKSWALQWSFQGWLGTQVLPRALGALGLCHLSFILGSAWLKPLPTQSSKGA